jgi:hypothetical protein
MRLLCSVLYLRDGNWPIIGRLQNWVRDEWPLPVFYRDDLLRGTVLVQYDDNLEEIEEVPYTGGDVKLVDKQRFSGSEAVKIRPRQFFGINQDT